MRYKLQLYRYACRLISGSLLHLTDTTTYVWKPPKIFLNVWYFNEIAPLKVYIGRALLSWVLPDHDKRNSYPGEF